MKVEYSPDNTIARKIYEHSTYGLYASDDNKLFILHTNAQTFLSIGPNSFSTCLWDSSRDRPTFNYRKIAELDQLTIKVN